MTNPLRKGKKFIVVTCKKCNQTTDITSSDAWTSMVVQNKTYKEELVNTKTTAHIMRLEKNGEIQALHRCIGELLNIMTPEQVEKARVINQRTKDEIKRALRK